MYFVVRLVWLRRFAMADLEVQRVLLEEALQQRHRIGAELENPQPA